METVGATGRRASSQPMEMAHLNTPVYTADNILSVCVCVCVIQTSASSEVINNKTNISPFISLIVHIQVITLISAAC